MQQLAFPAAAVKLEDAAGLGGELGIAGKDPGAVLPGLDRVLGQPAPYRTPEICSQIPRATASRASSPDDQRASGTSLSAGSSQAKRITSART